MTEKTDTQLAIYLALKTAPKHQKRDLTDRNPEKADRAASAIAIRIAAALERDNRGQFNQVAPSTSDLE